VSFPGVKDRGVALATHTPQYRAEVRERIELYLHSPLGFRGLFLVVLYLYNRNDLTAAKLLRKIINCKDKDTTLSGYQIRIS
jgi:hypothetical protein